MAILDSSGTITIVNAAWHALTPTCEHPAFRCHEGDNYVAMWDALSVNGDSVATRVAAGIRSANSNEPIVVIAEYPLQMPEPCWLIIRASRFTVDAQLYTLIIQEDSAKSKLHSQLALNVFSDTMEQRRYSHIHNRERFISRILESIPSSLVVIDRGLRVVSANHNFLEKARRELQQTLGRKLEMVFPTPLMEYTHMNQKVRDVFRLGHPIEGGKFAYRAPGLPTRIYYYRLIPLRFDEVIENVILFMEDITERDQLEEDVRRAEQHLASVVACASDLVISMDSHGSIVSWNAAAERVSGMSAEHTRGRTLLSLCTAQHQPIMDAMLRQLTRGEPVQNREAHLVTATGTEVPIAWSCAPMRDQAGEVVGTVVVGRDLTEQRQLEAQLVQSAKMASLGVMAGGIAHELRNPLGIILASAHLLLEYPEDVGMRDTCVQKIHTATQRASVIIENLLKFAHPNSERMRDVDIHRVLEETFNMLSDQIVVQHVVLQHQLDARQPIVYGNPELLQQVFTNLILNACHVVPHGGSLGIRTLRTDTQQVEIQFCDSGPGIPPENLARIFDPFFTTMPVGKGTGLGLSICYSIIQQHQGTIDVVSELGNGATFTVRLPLSGGEA